MILQYSREGVVAGLYGKNHPVQRSFKNPHERESLTVGCSQPDFKSAPESVVRRLCRVTWGTVLMRNVFLISALSMTSCSFEVEQDQSMLKKVGENGLWICSEDQREEDER